MPTRIQRSVTFLITLVVAAATSGSGRAAAPIGDGGQPPACSPGPRTIAPPGSRVYPDQGNGGYTNVHTDLHLVYDPAANLFLPGNHADLTIRATQCLTEFSLDFERTNGVTSLTIPGPDMTVSSVDVDGQPATFRFAQPTYPGDPNGDDDPDPAAHAASNTNPVSATNPNPPACTPQGSSLALNGLPCPANKLVITPAAPIPFDAAVVVTINYTGRPGVHVDGDGASEGWFRSNNPVGDGGTVSTEPVGAMAWMPLNNHPSAKPTYNINVTIPYDSNLAPEANPMVISGGRLQGSTVNAPDANFPSGSRTFSWGPMPPTANYLVPLAIGHYDFSERSLDPSDPSAMVFYESQASSISATVKASNKVVLDQQEDIDQFLSSFAGPFPFSSMGNIVMQPAAAFEEGMQTQNVWAGGRATAGTLPFLTMAQWFGGNVSVSGYDVTFLESGLSAFAQYLLTARTAATNAGGLGTPAGNAAFDANLVSKFNSTGNYNTPSTTFWTLAPSDPSANNLFSTIPRYTRPATAFLALRQILGGSASLSDAEDRWKASLRQITSQYSGRTISKQQLETVFHQNLPNQSAGCHAHLDDFFTQWFDTAYATGAANKPQITGPGLSGNGFYDDQGPCPRADQTVQFTALPDRQLNDADFAVNATATSGLPVTFSAVGACSVNDHTVHIGDSTGVCTIIASQSGNGIFKPSADVPQSFTVASGIAVSRGGFTYNPILRRYAQVITLTNTTAGNISAPISLILDNLSANATLANATGVQPTPTASPYVTSNISLASGQKATITLQFINPTNTAITYITRTLAGPAGQ